MFYLFFFNFAHSPSFFSFGKKLSINVYWLSLNFRIKTSTVNNSVLLGNNVLRLLELKKKKDCIVSANNFSPVWPRVNDWPTLPWLLHLHQTNKFKLFYLTVLGHMVTTTLWQDIWWYVHLVTKFFGDKEFWWHILSVTKRLRNEGVR